MVICGCLHCPSAGRTVLRRRDPVAPPAHVSRRLSNTRFLRRLTSAGICTTSESSASYLPSAVTCAVSKCNADEWTLDLVLGSLEVLCYGMQCPIPSNVMTEAYAAAGDAEQPQQPMSKPATLTSSKQSDHKSSKGGNNAQPLTSTIRSTFTKTTTDSNGNTLQIVVPIAVGPSEISTGAISTSTLSGRATSTSAPLSASSSASAAASVPNPTLRPSSTSAIGSQQTRGPGGGNGSPFDAPSGASIWLVSSPLLGLGTLAMMFMRL
jgi:hypothetical protein